MLAGVGSGTINQFTPAGAPVGSLNNGLGNPFDTGMCFDAAGNLLATNFSSTLTRFDPTGTVLPPNPFINHGATNESCAIDASGNVYVGGAGTRVLQVRLDGNLVDTFTPVNVDRGTDWIDLAADQKTMLYASEGNTIYRYDVSTHTQLAPFATGLPGPCFALRIRSNGEVLIACEQDVVRLSSTGTVIQTIRSRMPARCSR